MLPVVCCTLHVVRCALYAFAPDAGTLEAVLKEVPEEVQKHCIAVLHKSGS